MPKRPVTVQSDSEDEDVQSKRARRSESASEDEDVPPSRRKQTQGQSQRKRRTQVEDEEDEDAEEESDIDIDAAPAALAEEDEDEFEEQYSKDFHERYEKKGEGQQKVGWGLPRCLGFWSLRSSRGQWCPFFGVYLLRLMCLSFALSRPCLPFLCALAVESINLTRSWTGYRRVWYH